MQWEASNLHCNTMYNFLRKSRCWTRSICICIFLGVELLILLYILYFICYIQHGKYNERFFMDDKWCSYCCWFEVVFYPIRPPHNSTLRCQDDDISDNLTTCPEFLSSFIFNRIFVTRIELICLYMIQCTKGTIPHILMSISKWHLLLLYFVT